MSIHLEHLLSDLLAPAAVPVAGAQLWIADESLSERELLGVRAHPALHVLTNRCDLAAQLR